VDAVELPVIAAGGIGDGRGVAAVLALGAQGAWLGTRFIATEEAHHLYKDRVLEALETDTVHTNVFSEGWPAPHRTLRNAASEAGAQRPASMPQNPDELETAALYSGQSAGLVHAIRPAAEVVQELAAEAEVALSGAGNEPAR
jgi:nitronate monooxygenase